MISKCWYTYIVQCNDSSLYVGIAKDFNKRIAEHNSGGGAKYTRSRRPVTLVYLEKFSCRSKASSREYQLKKMDRNSKLKVLKDHGNILVDV